MTEESSIISPTSLNFGVDGSLQLAYHAWRPGGAVALYYGTRTAYGWNAEIVAHPATQSMAILNSDGTPHIAYRGAETGQASLHYATRVDGQWVREHILTGPYVRVAIALDSANRPHVLGLHQHDLEYAVRNGDHWHVESLGAAGLGNLGFAIGSDDRMHLTSAPPGGNAFRYWTKQPNAPWQMELVPGCSGDTALTLDSQDRPHVACRDVARGVIYAWNDGGTWHQEIAAGRSMFPPPPFNSHPTSYIGQFPSIALDSQERPHIGFRVLYDLANPDNVFFPGRLHYATKVNTEWRVEVVEKEGQNNGSFTSIQIDTQDRPHISYVYTWRWASPGALAPLNTGWEIRYATPLAGIALGPAGL